MARGFRMGGGSAIGGDALPEDILEGRTAYVGGEEITGDMPDIGSFIQAITALSQQVNIPEGYHDGTGYVEIDDNEEAKLIPDNIRKDVSVLNVVGNLEEGIDTSDANATASDILNGVTGYVNGAKITGNIPSQAAKTVTPATTSQTAVSAGYYCSGNITVAAIPNQTTGGTKYASTSAQTLLTAPKYLTSNLTVAALSQTNLTAANIKNGVTISISNGSSNVWSVKGTATGYKIKTFTCKTPDAGHYKVFPRSNSENLYYMLYATINPGMTPYAVFSFGTDYKACRCWRTSSTTAQWVMMYDNQSQSTTNISGWAWSSTAIDIPCQHSDDTSTFYTINVIVIGS